MLQYSDKRPNKEGFYFLRYRALPRHFLAEVFTVNGALRVNTSFGHNLLTDFDNSWQWAGPISEPVDPVPCEHPDGFSQKTLYGYECPHCQQLEQDIR